MLKKSAPSSCVLECNADTETNGVLDLTERHSLDNEWRMRLSLSHPPESRRLLVAGFVCWIISGFYFREPFHADGVNLYDPVLELDALNLVLDLAISTMPP